MTYNLKEQLKAAFFPLLFLTFIEKELILDKNQNSTEAFTKKVGQGKALSREAIIEVESNQDWNTREQFKGTMKGTWGGMRWSMVL